VAATHIKWSLLVPTRACPNGFCSQLHDVIEVALAMGSLAPCMYSCTVHITGEIPINRYRGCLDTSIVTQLWQELALSFAILASNILELVPGSPPAGSVANTTTRVTALARICRHPADGLRRISSLQSNPPLLPNHATDLLTGCENFCKFFVL
jgi:hypothetical protein